MAAEVASSPRGATDRLRAGGRGAGPRRRGSGRQLRGGGGPLAGHGRRARGGAEPLPGAGRGGDGVGRRAEEGLSPAGRAGPPGQERAPASGGGLQGAAGGLGHRQQPREEEGVRDEADGGERAEPVRERVPEQAAGRPEGGHEHHDVQQVPGQAQEVRAGPRPAQRPLLRRVRAAAPRRGGRLLGRVQPAGAEDHLLRRDGRQGLRHHRVGRLPARGDLPRHPPRPLPHLLRGAQRRRGRAAEERLQGQPQLRRRPAGLLHPRVPGDLRTDARGLPAAPPARSPPGDRGCSWGPAEDRGGRSQGRCQAQEAEEGAAPLPALSVPRVLGGAPWPGEVVLCRALQGLFEIKKKSIFFF